MSTLSSIYIHKFGGRFIYQSNLFGEDRLVAVGCKLLLAGWLNQEKFSYPCNFTG